MISPCFLLWGEWLLSPAVESLTCPCRGSWQLGHSSLCLKGICNEIYFLRSMCKIWRQECFKSRQNIRFTRKSLSLSEIQIILSILVNSEDSWLFFSLNLRDSHFLTWFSVWEPLLDYSYGISASLDGSAETDGKQEKREKGGWLAHSSSVGIKFTTSQAHGMCLSPLSPKLSSQPLLRVIPSFSLSSIFPVTRH